MCTWLIAYFMALLLLEGIAPKEMSLPSELYVVEDDVRTDSPGEGLDPP